MPPREDTRGTIPHRWLFRREATVTAQRLVTSLTLLIATALEAALAHLELTVRRRAILVVRAWRHRGRQMSDLAPRHHRMLELAHLTLDLTLHILELGPHLQIPAPEQEVTATRNPSVVDTRR